MELAARKILEGAAAQGTYAWIAQGVCARSLDPYMAAAALVARLAPRLDAGDA